MITRTVSHRFTLPNTKHHTHPHTPTHTQIASKPRKKQPKDQEGEDVGRKKRGRKPSEGGPGRVKRPKLKPSDPGYDPYDFSSDEDDAPDDVSKSHDGDESHDQIQEEAMETDQGGRVHLGDER